MISPLAYVDSKAVIGNNVTIHPFAYIDKDAVSYTHLTLPTIRLV